MTSLGILEIGLRLNKTHFDAGITQVRKEILGLTQQVNLKITPQVDHAPLTALNKHLDRKLEHFKRVQQYFNQNPLVVKTQYTEERAEGKGQRAEGNFLGSLNSVSILGAIASLNRNLSGLDKRLSIPATPQKIEVSGLDKAIKDLTAQLSRPVSIPVTSTGSVPKNPAEEAAFRYRQAQEDKRTRSQALKQLTAERADVARQSAIARETFAASPSGSKERESAKAQVAELTKQANALDKQIKGLGGFDKPIPKQYQELIRLVTGGLPNVKAPQLLATPKTLGDANAKYNVTGNFIQVPPATLKALEEGKLAGAALKTLLHELAHAVQFDFGSVAGVQGSKHLQPTGDILKESQISAHVAQAIEEVYPKSVQSLEKDAEQKARNLYQQYTGKAIKGGSTIDAGTGSGYGELITQIRKLVTHVETIAKSFQGKAIPHPQFAESQGQRIPHEPGSNLSSVERSNRSSALADAGISTEVRRNERQSGRANDASGNLSRNPIETRDAAKRAAYNAVGEYRKTYTEFLKIQDKSSKAALQLAAEMLDLSQQAYQEITAAQDLFKANSKNYKTDKTARKAVTELGYLRQSVTKELKGIQGVYGDRDPREILRSEYGDELELESKRAKRRNRHRKVKPDAIAQQQQEMTDVILQLDEQIKQVQPLLPAKTFPELFNRKDAGFLQLAGDASGMALKAWKKDVKDNWKRMLVVKGAAGLGGTIAGGLTGTSEGALMGAIAGRTIGEIGYHDTANFATQVTGMVRGTKTKDQAIKSFAQKRVELPEVIRKATTGQVLGVGLAEVVKEVNSVIPVGKLIDLLMPKIIEYKLGDGIEALLRTAANPSFKLDVPGLPPNADKAIASAIRKVSRIPGVNKFVENILYAYVDRASTDKAQKLKAVIHQGANFVTGGNNFLGERAERIGLSLARKGGVLGIRSGLSAIGLTPENAQAGAQFAINRIINQGLPREVIAPSIIDAVTDNISARVVSRPAIAKVNRVVNKPFDYVDPHVFLNPKPPEKSETELLLEEIERKKVKQAAIAAKGTLKERIVRKLESINAVPEAAGTAVEKFLRSVTQNKPGEFKSVNPVVLKEIQRILKEMGRDGFKFDDNNLERIDKLLRSINTSLEEVIDNSDLSVGKAFAQKVEPPGLNETKAQRFQLDFERRLNTSKLLSPVRSAINLFGDLDSLLQATFAGNLIYQFGAQISAITQKTVGLYIQFEQIKNTLKSIPSISATGALGQIDQLANRLGVDKLATAQDFGQFASALSGTALGGNSTELFASLVESFKRRGLGNEQQQRAIQALIQVASKGEVQQEELRGQLAEALPGATGIAARGFGLSEGQFNQRVAAGITGNEFLPKFAKQLASESGTGTLDSYSVKLGRAKNAQTDFNIAVGETLAVITTPALLAAPPFFTLLKAIAPGVILSVLGVSTVIGVNLVTSLAAAAAQAGLLKNVMIGLKASLALGIGIGLFQVISEQLNLIPDEVKKVLDEVDAEIQARNNRQKQQPEQPKFKSDKFSSQAIDFLGAIGQNLIRNPFTDKKVNPLKEGGGIGSQRELQTRVDAVKDAIAKTLGVQDSIDVAIGVKVTDDFKQKLTEIDAAIDKKTSQIRFGEISGASIAGLQKMQGELQALTKQRDNLINEIFPDIQGEFEKAKRRYETALSEATQLRSQGGGDAAQRQIDSAKQKLDALAALQERFFSLLKTIPTTLEKATQALIKVAGIQGAIIDREFNRSIAASGNRVGILNAGGGQKTVDFKLQQDALNNSVKQLADLKTSLQQYRGVTLSLTQAEQTFLKRFGGSEALLQAGRSGKINQELINQAREYLSQNKADPTIAKNVEAVFKKFEATRDIERQIADKELEIATSRRDIVLQKIAYEDYLRNLGYQVADFNRNLNRQAIDLQEQFRSFTRQTEDSQIQAFKEARGLSESYQDLVYGIARQIKQTQIEIENIEQEIAATKTKNILRQTLQPGVNSAGKQLVDLFTSAVDELKASDIEKRSLSNQVDEINQNYVQSLRQIRDLQEQQLDIERSRLRMQQDLLTQQRKLFEAQTDFVLQAQRQIEGFIREQNQQLGGVKFQPSSVPATPAVPGIQGSVPQGYSGAIAPKPITPVPPQKTGSDRLDSLIQGGGLGKYAPPSSSVPKLTGSSLADILNGTVKPATRNPSVTPSRPTRSSSFSPSERAFLDVIAYAEGADYNTLYGGGKFHDYSRHPMRRIKAGRYTSSAAGRYQILDKTWLGLQRQYGFKDFSPATQDQAAIALIKNRGALDEVQSGNFEGAINQLGGVWASLPSSRYGQPTKRMSELRRIYEQRLRLYGGGNLRSSSMPRPEYLVAGAGVSDSPGGLGLPPLPQNNYPAAQGQVKSLRDLQLQKVGLQGQQIDEKRLEILLNIYDRFKSTQLGVEQSIRESNRQMRDTSSTVDDLVKNGKGYLTVNEQIEQSVRNSTYEYYRQAESLSDLKRQKEQFNSSSDETIAVLREQAAQYPEFARQFEEVIKTVSSQVEQNKKDIPILTGQINALTQAANTNAAAVRERETERIRLEANSKIAGYRAEFLDASAETSDPLTAIAERMESAVLRIRINFAQTRFELDKLVKDGTITGAAIEQSYTSLKKLEDLQLQKAFIDANPFAQAFNSELEAIFTSSKSVSEALQGLAKSILQVFAAWAAKSITNSLFGALGGLFGGGASEVPLLGHLATGGFAIPTFSDGGGFKSPFSLMEGIDKAMIKERSQSGFKPALIVANEKEWVLNPDDTKTYLKAKQSGAWNQFKENRNIRTFSVGGAVSAGSQAIGDRASVSNNSSVTNYWEIKVENANQLGETMSQLNRKTALEAERAKNRFGS